MCLFVLPVFFSFAEDSNTVNFKKAETYIANSCDEELLNKAGIKYSGSLTEYDKQVTAFALMACKSIFGKVKVTGINKYWDNSTQGKVLDLVNNEFSGLFDLTAPDTHFPLFKSQLSEWQALTSLPLEQDAETIPILPYVENQLNGVVNLEYGLIKTNGRDVSGYFLLNTQQEQHCKNRIDTVTGCREVFDEFEIVTKKLSVFQRYHTSKQFEAYTASKKKEWDKFSDNSRFMTFVDVAFTSWVYRNRLSLSNDLNSPPPYQLFAFRPSIIYEHLGDAPKGKRDKFGVAVEWLGINAWDWKLPVGVSIASVYSDRESAKSIGHGLMFHFKNDFSVGWANRSGENSFYINFEFKDWFSEKQDLQSLF
jgi:hypothetical protein